MISLSRLAIVLLLAFSLRTAVVIWQFERLAIDTDAYLAIAERLQAGDGFCSVSGHPSAFRPPLYPLLVAGCLQIGGSALLGGMQVVAGTATVALTFVLARRWGLGDRSSLAAAALVAADPLLLAYTSQAMTETLASLLTVALFVAWPQSTDNEPQTRRAAAAGVLLGLAALCRPTIWAYALLTLAAALWRRLRAHERRFDWPARKSVIFAATTLLVLAPWMIRNAIVFGQPIVTTTHGGYTLLLGNNEAFYREVVAQPFGTVWPADKLGNWQQTVEEQLARQGIARNDELARDAAMKSLAMEWMRAKPSAALSCVWFRIRNLWSPVPLERSGLPQFVVGIVGAYYLALLLAVVVGLTGHRLHPRGQDASLALLLSLTLLHSLYWANARMRAPAVPVLAILAVAGIGRLRQIREAGVCSTTCVTGQTSAVKIDDHKKL